MNMFHNSKLIGDEGHGKRGVGSVGNRVIKIRRRVRVKLSMAR